VARPSLKGEEILLFLFLFLTIMEEEIKLEVEQILGYKFHNEELLALALIHTSAVDNRLLSNERLEFLGDAVLALVHKLPRR
jgi:dsRNA-specific ribonuclease